MADFVRHFLCFGVYKTKGGNVTNCYFDFRQLTLDPQHLKDLINLCKGYNSLQHDVDCLVTLGFGAIPFATAVSLEWNLPLVCLRSDQKQHGRTQLERLNALTQTPFRNALFIDDVVTAGTTLNEAQQMLVETNVRIRSAFVILDRRSTNTSAIPVHSLARFDQVVKLNPQHPIDVRKWIRNIVETKHTRLCASLDFNDIDSCTDAILVAGHLLCMVKVHPLLWHDFDVAKLNCFVTACRDKNVAIMADCKFNDIAYIVEKQLHHLHLPLWANLITVQLIGGPGILDAFENITTIQPFGVIAIHSMSTTRNMYDTCAHALGVLVEENMSRMVGLVTQRKISKGNLILMTPGVHLHETGDQFNQRYRKPSVLRREIGTEIFIVGRALRQSLHKSGGRSQLDVATVSQYHDACMA